MYTLKIENVTFCELNQNNEILRWKWGILSFSESKAARISIVKCCADMEDAFAFVHIHSNKSAGISRLHKYFSLLSGDILPQNSTHLSSLFKKTS